MLNTEQLNSLQSVLDDGQVVTDPADLQSYAVDRTKVWQPNASALVFPRTSEDVQAVVCWANEHQVALVPSGGRTGLSGAAVAHQGEIVVSFDKMNAIQAFNPADRTVRCQAGVILQQLQEYAEEQGLFYPVDWAAKGSAQIGGGIATNAGGIKVIRYGNTRNWVAGLQVVTGSGEILELNHGLVKNNSGYDLSQLFIASEGTLGFITEATLRLTRQPDDLAVMVLGVNDLADIIRVLETFQRSLELTAFEFFDHNGMTKVMAHSQLQAPFESEAPYYALIEFERAGEVMEQVMALFEQVVEAGWVLDGTISQSQSQAENLWRLREDMSETLAEWQPYKNDVAVPVAQIPDFVVELTVLIQARYPDFEVVLFGHIGDGNIHVNILKPATVDGGTFYQQCRSVSDELFGLVQARGGTISAEHGIGLLKKDFLTYTRSAEEVAIMKGIKQVFDPNGIINPGKIFD